MLIYYSLIVLSVVMFGGGFAIQDLYRKKRGSGLRISMESACIGAIAGAAVLLISNGTIPEITPFTLLMAVCASLNGMAFTFCAFKALDYINLSLFSLFAMLGGMLLPFLQGILFFGEGFTLAKAACVVLIAAALSCTVKRGEKGRGTFFYIGIFVLNGMSGVISKLFTASELPKTSALEYSMWIAVVTALLSGAVWLVLSLQEWSRAVPSAAAPSRKMRLQSYGLGAAYGVLNRVANLLLVYALVFVDSSVQYPMVTGGTMIVSTVLSCFGEKKPHRRELVGVALAFAGMCALFFIPA